MDLTSNETKQTNKSPLLPKKSAKKLLAQNQVTRYLAAVGELFCRGRDLIAWQINTWE